MLKLSQQKSTIKYCFLCVCAFFVCTVHAHMDHMLKNAARAQAKTKKPVVSETKPAAENKMPEFEIKHSVPAAKKKKLVIAWSDGGGCHISMLKALKLYFGDTYDIVDFKPVADVLYPLDPIYKLTRHAYRGEDFYNYLLSNDMPWLVNKMLGFGISGIRRHHKRIVCLLEKYLKSQKPDAVISVIPLFNSALAEVSKNMQIPFLAIIPDNIKNTFLLELPRDVDHIYCTVPVNDLLWLDDARADGIDSKLIKATGFPLRPDFFELKNKEKIKADFSVPKGKPVVMLLMGGAGSTKLFNYVRRLIKFSDPIHIFVCVGRNAETGEKIKKIKLPKHITLSVIGYTTRISDLMAVSDVLITKTGPGTLFEAIEMQLPLLVDATSTVLECERPYIDTIKKLGLGEVLTGFGKFRDTLHDLLSDQQKRESIKKAMGKLSNRDYPEKIKKIVADMLAKPVKPLPVVTHKRRTPIRRRGEKKAESADEPSAQTGLKPKTSVAVSAKS